MKIFKIILGLSLSSIALACQSEKSCKVETTFIFVKEDYTESVDTSKFFNQKTLTFTVNNRKVEEVGDNCIRAKGLGPCNGRQGTIQNNTNANVKIVFYKDKNLDFGIGMAELKPNETISLDYPTYFSNPCYFFVNDIFKTIKVSYK